LRAGLVRFAIEAAFIGAVLAAARIADLKVVWIIVCGVAAWLLAAIAESLFTRGWQGAATFVPPVRPLMDPLERLAPVVHAPAPAPTPTFDAPAVLPEDIAPEWLESAEVLGVHVSGFEPALPEPEAVTLIEPAVQPEPEPAVAEPEPEPVAEVVEEAPEAEVEPEPAPPEPEPKIAAERKWPWRRGRADEAPSRVQREPKDQTELPLFELPERTCVSCGNPISKERLRAIPDATQCIDCKRQGLPEFAHVPAIEEPEAVPVAYEPPPPEPAPVAAVAPEPEPEPEPEPQPVFQPPPVREPEPMPVAISRKLPAGVREWNVWELERLARQRGGQDAARDEEWAFLLVYLREFANPEGVLPSDFDALVRESFPELVSVSETA
jgi:hypothetical protein